MYNIKRHIPKNCACLHHLPSLPYSVEWVEKWVELPLQAHKLGGSGKLGQLASRTRSDCQLIFNANEGLILQSYNRFEVVSNVSKADGKIPPAL